MNKLSTGAQKLPSHDGLASKVYRSLTRKRPLSRAWNCLIDLFVPVRRRYFFRRILMAIGKHRVSVRLPHARLEVDLRDYGVGTPLYVKHDYEPAETALFQAILKLNMKMLDIGANIGYYTTLASKLVGPSGKVVAVEPEPRNFELLERNLRYNRCRNTIAVRAALGETSRKMLLYLSNANNFGDHQLYGGEDSERTSIETMVEVGDDLLKRVGVESIDFIKIDVQGYELHVLKGLRSTLGNPRKIVVLSEIWPFGLKRAGSSAMDLLKYLQSLRLQPAKVEDNGAIREISWEAAEMLVTSPELQGESDYTNLVFQRL